MAKRSNFSKLSQMRESERARALQGNPSLLSGLTPTQIAELFPDYFKRGTPDVGGFHAAISKASAERQSLWQGSVDSRLDRQGGMLSRMREEYAGEGKISNPVRAQEIYNYLRSKGVDHTHAVGMLNNIQHESALNSGAYNPNDVNGPSGGLFQHHSKFSEGSGGRFNDMVRFAGPDWKTNWKKQIDFALQEGDTKRYLSTNFESAAAASVGFTQMFERPRDPNAGIERLSTIKSFDRLTPTDTATADAAGKGQTPQQTGGATTPGAPAGDTTAQAGKVVEGTKFNVISGYVVPQDGSLYDPRNAQECATLGKAFNPSIGRSSGWTIVDGDIKAGQVVATKQYNNGGADRRGAGYHTGVALTSPNEKGDFLLLEQYNGSGGAKTKWVNKDSYPIPGGGTTSFGLISSGGKVHDEISQEALAYGEKLGGPNKESVGTNAGTPGQGGETAPGVEGEVTGGPGSIGGTTVGEGEQQSASLMQPVAMMQNLMGMVGGMVGGSASPLGLITSAMGFIMPLIGSIAGERLTGEGMGDGRGHHRRHGHGRGHTQGRTHVVPKSTTQSVPAQPVDNTPISHRADIGQLSVKYESGGRGVATISSGRKDPGGVSYGEHQLASKTGTMGRYLGSPEAKTYAEKFSGLKPGSAAFNKVYKKLAEEDPKGFGKSQQDYITRTHYEPVYRHAKSLGYNVNDPRVQEALYSISVQHGGAKKVVDMAKSSIGADPEKQVESLFGARRQYVASKGMNFDTRYKSEKREILAMDLTKYKQPDEMPTQFAGVRPETTTGQIGAGVTTPTAAPMVGTQMAAQEPKGFAQQAKEFVTEKLGSGKATAQPSMGTAGSPTTPMAGPGQTTPTYVSPGTPSVSTSISNAAAPAAPISKSARTPFGIYANPSKTDIMNQFGYRKELSATPVTSTSNVPAAPAIPPTVVPTKGAMMQAPGPAPDTTAIQMRTQMQTAAMTSGETQRPMLQMQQAPQVSHILNHDHTMKMIQNPIDTPSAGRAFARAEGRESDTRAIGNERSYGNQ